MIIRGLSLKRVKEKSSEARKAWNRGRPLEVVKKLRAARDKAQLQSSDMEMAIERRSKRLARIKRKIRRINRVTKADARLTRQARIDSSDSNPGWVSAVNEGDRAIEAFEKYHC